MVSMKQKFEGNIFFSITFEFYALWQPTHPRKILGTFGGFTLWNDFFQEDVAEVNSVVSFDFNQAWLDL